MLEGSRMSAWNQQFWKARRRYEKIMKIWKTEIDTYVRDR